MANASKTDSSERIRELARLCGLQVAYDDATGRQVDISDESLLAVLPALGVPVQKPEDASDAYRDRLQSLWRRPVEPVVVSWNGSGATVELRLPAGQMPQTINGRLRLETGEELLQSFRPLDPPDHNGAIIEGVTYAAKHLRITDPLPLGYHSLLLDLPSGTTDTLILAAPRRAYSPSGKGWERSWGVFLPLYSLYSKQSYGTGDFGDLETLTQWVQEHHGNLVGTLPLMPAFLDEPYEISPYSPVSRLFWNEFYLNLKRIPEVRSSHDATAILSQAIADEPREGKERPLIDYRRIAAGKRRVLEAAQRDFFENSSDRRASFETYVSSHPYANDYAVFRAIGEQTGKPWYEWNQQLREGKVQLGDFDEDAKRYHLFVQWLADEQLKAVSDRAGASGGGLYLDLPLGVHAAGYDIWREREAFAVGVAGGAPPDPGFPKGQNWGFVPLHPQGIRDQKYRYVRAFVRHQLQYASVLRIDHMPNFHRVFWIPPGKDARDGTYVRYPAEELYALFSLESHRYRTLLIGEDLGTIPPEVPAAMARHNFHQMSVTEYELKPDPSIALPQPPASSLACINTHDMPPFAAYWSGSDISERVTLGLIDEETAQQESELREALRQSLVSYLQGQGFAPDPADARTILRALLASLRDSPARVLLVNLEDLWLETESQNVPSTAGEESPNWRRRARYSFEEFAQRPEVTDLMNLVAQGYSVDGVQVAAPEEDTSS